MKKLFALLLLCLFSTDAIAQSQLAPGQVWGNSTAIKAPPTSTNISPLFDRAFTGSQGQVFYRGSSVWAGTSTPVLGVPGSVAGSLGIAGLTSGTATISAQPIAGITNFILPTSSGTFAVSASSPIILNSTTGIISCPTCLSTGSGVALTASNDANVTLTLGGTPATALVNAASITAGWTGLLAPSRGGTGISSLGAGVATALGIATGNNAGSFITYNGPAGTPSTISLAGGSNCAVSTCVSGLGTGIATFLGTPSSANLRSALTDETGTGLAYFQGGDIGTPSAGVATNITALNATQLTTGTIPAARTNGHQNGTATNDNAAAGEIGEYLENTATGVALTTATAANVGTITLTAGDWDVDITMSFLPANTTSVTRYLVSLGTTSATVNATIGRLNQTVIPATAFDGATSMQTVIVPYRMSVSTSTQLWAVAQSTFTVSTNAATGIIRARRVR